MGDLIIWKIVGGVSAINGVACFALSSTYDMFFGKLGFYGHLAYLLACLIIWCLMLRAKSIQVSEKVQGVMAALIFVVICSISVLLDKLVPGKSDALSIISYGSFALMSVSMSRKLELGFETGISTSFLQLFAAQLFKIKWFLFPIALVFCSLVIILRHYSSESRVQSGSITPNGYPPIQVRPPDAAVINIIGEEDINERQDSPEMGEVSVQGPLTPNGYPPIQVGPPDAPLKDIIGEEGINERQESPEMGEVSAQGPLTPNGYPPIQVGPLDAPLKDIIGEEGINERQDSPEMGEVSGQGPLSTNNEQNSQEESSQAVGEVSEENISDWENELNSEEEDGSWSSLATEYLYPWKQDSVPFVKYKNGWMPSSPPSSPLLRRRRIRCG